MNTLVYDRRASSASLVLGLAFALLLHRPFPLRGLVRSLMIAPFFVMPTVSAVVWKNLLLNPVFGLSTGSPPRSIWGASTGWGAPKFSLITIIRVGVDSVHDA